VAGVQEQVGAKRVALAQKERRREAGKGDLQCGEMGSATSAGIVIWLH